MNQESENERIVKDIDELKDIYGECGGIYAQCRWGRKMIRDKVETGKEPYNMKIRI